MTTIERRDALWLPFTPNRQFKANPLLFARARGMYYETVHGDRVLDAMAGLWCVNAGHGQARITAAVQRAAAQLDFVSSFRMSHPAAFELAARMAQLAPRPLDYVFFGNSGSEAVDTALKIARAYHRIRGEGTRWRFIGRARAYHGMGWGGLSVGGIGRHRRDFGPLLPGVDHLAHAYDPERSRFSRGQPAWGQERAEELERLIQLHDASTIAAVMVEPVTGSGGVFPPPQGYLERLRAICSAHGILLIFDEVITGYGRLGAPFAAQRFGVTPDIITCAKGLTNGAVPMGATLVSRSIYETFMSLPEREIELSHGYTYSAHPLACAAGLAMLETVAELDLFARAARLEPAWELALHGLRGAPHVADLRNIGLLGAIELEPRPGAPGARGAECAAHALRAGVLLRSSGDTLLLSPPLIIGEDEIALVFATIAAALTAIA